MAKENDPRLEARVFVAAAALLGASGVAAAALGSHTSSGAASSLSMIALTHAPVMLILAERAAANRFERLARFVLAVGVLGFCLDMGLRSASGVGFGALAPIFGIGMILGWLGIGFSRVSHATYSSRP